jgi:RNA 3'-terminal phosphate cyclase (ATP)
VDTIGPLDVNVRGALKAYHVRAMVANLPRHIAARECETIAKNTGWASSCFAVEEIQSGPGPGNVVMVELESEHVTEVFVGFGRRGVRAERIAKDVLHEVNSYLQAEVPVGRYLADQLMLPLGIGAWQGSGGGSFGTLALSAHAKTHLQLLQSFLPINVAADHQGGEAWQVRITPADCRGVRL